MRKYFKESENKERTRKTFIEIIDRKFADAYDKYNVWCDEYNTHIHAISLVDNKIIETDIEKDNQLNEIKVKIFHKVGAYYHKVQSKNELALRNAEKALEMREKLYTGDHSDKATSYNYIGLIYKHSDLEKSLE